MKNVLILTGPTASGKTDIAINIAKKRNGEIISCDSMQIYKGMDIGTAKPTIKDRQKIKHYNIDIINPEDKFSVAQFKKRTINIIDDILKRNKLPIIVGGTGLYIDSLIFNIEFKEQNNNTEIRNKYEKIYKEKGIDYLYNLLLKKDKDAQNKIHKNNIKRVIRSLEILENEKSSLEEYKKNAISTNDKYNFILVVLKPERQYVYKRIEKRIDLMIELGLIDEVKNIYNKVNNENAIALQAIGYKEVIWYLKGHINYNEMIRLLKRNTRHYAKRQFTWFRRYKNASIINIDENYKKEAICTDVEAILDNKSIF